VERGARVEQYGDGHCDARGKPRQPQIRRALSLKRARLPL
jgi:hypothetical protein